MLSRRGAVANETASTGRSEHGNHRLPIPTCTEMGSLGPQLAQEVVAQHVLEEEGELARIIRVDHPNSRTQMAQPH